VGTHHLTWAVAAAAGDGDAGGGDTRQIIVALIGALALILVALIPALVNLAKRESATTTPSPPAPAGATPEETARLWAAIEKVQSDQQQSFREHAGYDALLDECRRDTQQLSGEVAKIREAVSRHVYGPGHGPA